MVLSACATQDMQGHDPRDYYKQHPIVNKLASKSKTVLVHFASGENRLSPGAIEGLRDDLHTTSMLAVQVIHVGTARVDGDEEARKTHLKKMLRNMGYQKGKYVFEKLNSLSAGEMQIDLSYDVVVSPECPDWRRSPVTTHSNTSQGNFECASTVNLGLMVADPHDLVHGSDSDIPIDTTTATKAVQDYHEGKTAAGSVSASGGSSSTGSNSATESGSGAATQ